MIGIRARRMTWRPGYAVQRSDPPTRRERHFIDRREGASDRIKALRVRTREVTAGSMANPVALRTHRADPSARVYSELFGNRPVGVPSLPPFPEETETRSSAPKRLAAGGAVAVMVATTPSSSVGVDDVAGALETRTTTCARLILLQTRIAAKGISDGTFAGILRGICGVARPE
jgi:hypothetical protein